MTATATPARAAKPAKAAKPAAAPTTKSVELPFVKSTAGTHVYGIAEKEGICRQVYLQKGEMPDDPPGSITLTVSWK